MAVFGIHSAKFGEKSLHQEYAESIVLILRNMFL